MSMRVMTSKMTAQAFNLDLIKIRLAFVRIDKLHQGDPALKLIEIEHVKESREFYFTTDVYLLKASTNVNRTMHGCSLYILQLLGDYFARICF